MIQLLKDLLVLKSSTKTDNAFNRGQAAGIDHAILILKARMSFDNIAEAEALAKKEVSRA
jgi:hypothetical protein